ncbi:hypothetical protein ACQQ2Q_04050 [Agrobacterium sp. ES01]|uniref:hypothetical protein n=1 Tax=Agrobacterium sp. ES01 TaxID=3420714 RepID=UPI003D0DA042
MILEALNYLATWPLTTADHRSSIRYSVNLWSRASRCAKDWAAHEDNSKRAMLSAIADLKQTRTAVVLGSGLLRDVPIVELAKTFDTVVLVDLVHLASVRAWLRIKGLHNVRSIERDLSGFDALIAGREAQPLDFLRQVPYLDFVASANLLSQIGRGAKRRLEASGQPAMEPVAQLARTHIDGLQNLPCRTCLITDIAYGLIDRTGQQHESFDLLYGAEPPMHSAQWDWPVVPLGEESPDYRIVHTVIAAIHG